MIAILEHPSQRILSMFTKVQILKSGETVYFGPVGSNCDIVRVSFTIFLVRFTGKTILPILFLTHLVNTAELSLIVNL